MIDKVLARQVIESVGSSGTPPETGVSHFSVGLDPYLNAIRDEYLKTFIKGGGSAFKLVVGPFGGGKTHFLYSVRDMAWSENFAVAYVSLTPNETPFHSLNLVYRSLAAQISTGPDVKGIEEVIREAKPWSGTLEATKFAQAVRGAQSAENESQFEEHLQVLKGETLDKADAPRMIRSMIQWVRQIGRSGLVILFDEAELVPSFSRKQKEILINNLRELIDRCCQSSFRGAMVFYAIPDEKTLEGRGTAYEALKQRLATVFDVPNPTGIKIYLERIAQDPVGFLTEVGTRLSDVFETAYAAKLDKTKLVPALKALAKQCYEKRFADISYKRLFVQSAVALMNQVRASKDYAIDRLHHSSS
jgi:hypothetical protein